MNRGSNKIIHKYCKKPNKIIEDSQIKYRELTIRLNPRSCSGAWQLWIWSSRHTQRSRWKSWKSARGSLQPRGSIQAPGGYLALASAHRNPEKVISLWRQRKKATGILSCHKIPGHLSFWYGEFSFGVRVMFFSGLTHSWNYVSRLSNAVQAYTEISSTLCAFDCYHYRCV